MTERHQVAQFLDKHGMRTTDLTLEAQKDRFLTDMKAGLSGKRDSLKMICTYISAEGDIPIEKPVIVMDAGGTNLRVALVTFDEKRKGQATDFRTYPMPGTKGELDAEAFFEALADCLMPVIHKSSDIGFCFSFPTEILPNKDGRLMHFNKEVKVTGVEGLMIGAELKAALKKRGVIEEKHLVLINDTVATLLGGKAAYPERAFDGYIGFILGTGTNTCYIEDNAKISKAIGLPDQGRTIINVESGGYAHAPRGDIDALLDSKTANPAQQQFEKMISGAYQGPLLLELMRQAALEGLFSSAVAEKLLALSELTAKDIDDFCYYPQGYNTLSNLLAAENADRSSDARTLYWLMDFVYERAAKLVVVNLAALIEKTGTGTDPLLPVCVAAEGTTFYKSKLFRGKLDFHVRQYLNDEKGLYCEFVKAENTTLMGTAIAALLNG